jgi:hypothetical protein
MAITIGAVLEIIYAVLAVVSIALAVYQMFQTPPAPPVPSPHGITGIPEAEQGMDVPVLFGSRWITKSNVVWWGNPHTAKIQVSSSELS